MRTLFTNTSFHFKMITRIIEIIKHSFSLLLLILFVQSCNKTVNDPLQHFNNNQKQQLTPSSFFLLEEFDVLKPEDVIKIGHSYMVMDGQHENIFSLINLASKHVVRGINKGSGPGDIVSLGNFQKKDNELLIYDISRKKISKITLLNDNSLALTEIKRIETDKQLFIVHTVDSNFIASGAFEDFWFACITKNGKILSTVDFPNFHETKDIPKMQLSIAHISTLFAVSPNNRKIVAVTQKNGVISFLDYTEKSTLEEYKRIEYYAPIVSVVQGGGIAFSKENKVGFCSVDCDDNYVYVLYSGRTFTTHGQMNHHCEHLLVYDWDGNPVKHYILDIPLFSMKYDSDNNSIYGIAYNPEGVFVEYNIDIH